MSMLEIRGVTGGLLDDPFDLQVRGVEAGDEVLWRARYRDDDMRVWVSADASALGLSSAWRPSKPSTGPVAALQSLRPVRVDVRVETGDGRAAARSLTREILGDGVRVRRWGAARLHLPPEPRATLLVDGPPPAVAAPLLASRGVIVLVQPSGSVDEALAGLASVPGATEAQVVPGGDIPVPPNVGGSSEAGAAVWDALIARLGARPRGAS
jgi:hypothetical protein